MPFCQVPISPIESQASSLLKRLMEHQTTKPKRILKLLQIILRYCGINCKINVINERRNSRVEFNGKNDQPKKKLDKFIIYLNRIL